MTAAEHEEIVTIEILRGSPTPEELAAVVAVVQDEYSAEVETLESEEDPSASAWMRSRRRMRTPLRRDIGWGRFFR